MPAWRRARPSRNSIVARSVRVARGSRCCSAASYQLAERGPRGPLDDLHEPSVEVVELLEQERLELRAGDGGQLQQAGDVGPGGGDAPPHHVAQRVRQLQIAARCGLPPAAVDAAEV